MGENEKENIPEQSNPKTNTCNTMELLNKITHDICTTYKNNKKYTNTQNGTILPKMHKAHR